MSRGRKHPHFHQPVSRFVQSRLDRAAAGFAGQDDHLAVFEPLFDPGQQVSRLQRDGPGPEGDEQHGPDIGPGLEIIAVAAREKLEHGQRIVKAFKHSEMDRRV